MDPHTATCIKCYEEDNSDLKKIIFSTAEWTKFAPNVLKSINSNNESYTDEFALEEISKKLNKPITPIISDLFNKKIIHTKIIKKEEIEENILEFLK
jgi:threonine synthase